MAEDIQVIGLDVSSFSPEKKQVLNEFVAIFDKLEKYDGMKVNPVMGEGLTSFNASISNTSKLLDELNSKISVLNNSNSATNHALKEEGKLLDENAKLKKKIADATSEQSKENAKLRQELAEIRKELKEEAQLNNARHQQKLKDIELKKQEALKDKEISAERKRIIKEIADNEKRAAKERADTERDRSREAQKNAKQIEQDLKEEQKQLDLTSDKWKQLKLLTKERQKTAVNNIAEYGYDDPRTKKSLKEAQESAAILDGINVDLENADGNATKFGRSMTRALSSLRTLAYILPGIGLAGIFNLAFESIGKVIESSGLLEISFEKLKDLNINLNTIFKDQVGIVTALVEKHKELRALNLDSVENVGKKIEVDKSRGLDPVTIVGKEVDNAAKRFDIAREKLLQIKAFSSDEGIKKTLEDRLEKIGIESAKLEEAKNQYSTFLKKRAGQYTMKDGKLIDKQTGTQMPVGEFFTEAQYQANVKSQESDLNKQIEKYNLLKGVADEYYDAKHDKETKDAENIKLKEDEARKQRTETAKDDISVRLDANQKILSNEIKSEEDKLNAFARIRSNQKQQNKVDRDNVLDNNTSTPAEIIIAKNKFKDANLKADAEYHESTLKLKEDYKQRRLTAQLAIDKDELDGEAIKNERIFKNENNSLEDRLLSYSIYLGKKQDEQDKEYLREKDRLSLKANDPTAIKELESLESNRLKVRATIQADAEKQVYDIVISSLDGQLKTIIETNRLEEEDNKAAHARELTELTTSFSKKLISVKKYKEERIKIDQKYKIQGLDVAIEEDIKQLDRLKKFLADEEKLKEKAVEDAGSAENQLNYAKTSGEGSIPDAQKNLDEANGKVAGLTKSIRKAQLEVQKAQESLDADRLKRAQAILDKEEETAKKRNEWLKAALKIEEALYKGAKQLGDAEYERRLKKLEFVKQTVDEQYWYEIAAIEKSSLTAKDKAALDIQLNQQKIEYDKQAALEEKRIRREKFIFDRDLSIAHIILSTAEKIMEYGGITPAAIAVAAVGAIELVTAIATPVPSYEKGTDYHPGGWARYGEVGTEMVKEPYKSPYLVHKETVSVLPKGTEIIPIGDSPVFTDRQLGDGWEQTRWLAKQIRKGKQEIKNEFKPVINIDLGYQNRKREILGN